MKGRDLVIGPTWRDAHREVVWARFHEKIEKSQQELRCEYCGRLWKAEETNCLGCSGPR